VVLYQGYEEPAVTVGDDEIFKAAIARLDTLVYLFYQLNVDVDFVVVCVSKRSLEV
jgi:hypothetical protein